MLFDEPLTVKMLPGMGALPEHEWSACYPDEVEGWAYYTACETVASQGMGMALATVWDRFGLVTAVPTFQMTYRLDTPLQGRLAGLGRLATRLAPGLMEWRMLGLGSPFGERCHLALRPRLTTDSATFLSSPSTF